MHGSRMAGGGRMLTGGAQFTRAGLCLVADQSLSGEQVAAALDPVVLQRGAPRAIPMDNGSACASRSMDAWAFRHRIQLDVIRPGKPVENGFIESFTGRLREECLNVDVVFTLEEGREKLARWQEDDTGTRPHRALQDQAPATCAAAWVATEHADPAARSPITGDPHVSDARFAVPPWRCQPITRRPNSPVSPGLHSRGRSPLGTHPRLGTKIEGRPTVRVTHIHAGTTTGGRSRVSIKRIQAIQIGSKYKANTRVKMRAVPIRLSGRDKDFLILDTQVSKVNKTLIKVLLRERHKKRR